MGVHWVLHQPARLHGRHRKPGCETQALSETIRNGPYRQVSISSWCSAQDIVRELIRVCPLARLREVSRQLTAWLACNDERLNIRKLE